MIKYYLTLFVRKNNLDRVKNHYIEDNKRKYDMAISGGKRQLKQQKLSKERLCVSVECPIALSMK